MSMTPRNWTGLPSLHDPGEQHGSRGSTYYVHHLNYDVASPDQRVARLSPGGDRTRDWVRAIAPIDDALRAADVMRFETHDVECVPALAQRLNPVDYARFQRVMVKPDSRN